jgi:hypothetical protein
MNDARIVFLVIAVGIPDVGGVGPRAEIRGRCGFEGDLAVVQSRGLDQAANEQKAG